MKAQQLKNSILQMAVQGKLVPQDPDDEPARVLLERIRAEKAKLIKEGKIKKEKAPSYIFRGEDNLPYEKIGDNEPICIAYEVPFEIPESWEWVRLGSLLFIVSGTSYKKEDVTNSGIRILRGGNIQSFALVLEEDDVFLPFSYKDEEKNIQIGDIVLVASTGSKAVIGKPAIINKTYPNTQIGAFLRVARPILNATSYFIGVIFQSDYYREHIRRSVQGTNINNIKAEYIEKLLIPLPPLAEQKRIVEALEALQPYINEYEAKETALTKLNADFLDLLKKSILQQAVMGKLVPQDENDEHAAVLLERIRAEKEALIKAGKLKKSKHESIIYRRDNSHYEKLDGVERCIDDELPFEIPKSWEWAKIKSIFNLQAGKNIQASLIHNESNSKDYLCYGGNGIRGFVDFYNHEGDFPIIGRQGALCGNINRATGKFYATEHAICVDTFADTDVGWACLFLKALNLNQYATATAQPGIAVTNINEVLIPIPPLAEQKRIVAKIEELLKACKMLFTLWTNP